LSDGGDSGPVKYRMSVMTSGPRTPVARRITPIGDVNFGEFFAGLTHPFTHVLVDGPRLGGGDGGGEGGGTGEEETSRESLGAIGAEAGELGEATPASRSQADSSAVAATTTVAARKPDR
jgi:hypothetical protein